MDGRKWQGGCRGEAVVGGRRKKPGGIQKQARAISPLASSGHDSAFCALGSHVQGAMACHLPTHILISVGIHTQLYGLASAATHPTPRGWNACLMVNDSSKKLAHTSNDLEDSESSTPAHPKEAGSVRVQACSTHLGV